MEEWVDRSGVAPGGSSAVSDASMDAVREILDSLGYTQGEINTAIKQAHDAQVGEDVEELVRYSLKLLGSGTH